MTIPRFYVGTELELKHDFWVHEHPLLDRWHELGLQTDDEIVLFDGVRTDRLYRIAQFDEREAHMIYITDYERTIPTREVYILWPETGSERDEVIIQTGVVLGASHFLPIIENDEHAARVDINAYRELAAMSLEQTERSDVPIIREPMTLEVALHELQGRVRVFIAARPVGESQLDLTESLALLVSFSDQELNGQVIEHAPSDVQTVFAPLYK